MATVVQAAAAGPICRHTAAMTAPVLLIPPMPDHAPALLAALARQRPGLPVLTWTRETPASALAEVQVVLGWRWPPGVLAALPRLRWVCAMAAGVEKLLVPELPAAVPMSRIVDPDQALGIAQYVALVVLAQTRGLVGYQAQQLRHDWTRHPMAAARQRVLVLGWGAVGQAVGAALSALGFQVSGWRRSSGPLAAALAGADIVVNSLPLTPDTTDLLNAAAFAALPRGAYLVNIARGGHVVEADLIAALRSGQLAGAALDVQVNEPLPADDPLWTAPGVLITPHIAAQSSPDTVAAQFVAGLDALAAGTPLPNPVDRALGY
ncbi:MAG: glyoxylate/hydroxypyruvate reductase A [Burkholderiales bacterium PBB5]|nr:MAG: glyoxylate/hydroxypyruvate reductase A [Burkholderiales bacterium PBB5]